MKKINFFYMATHYGVVLIPTLAFIIISLVTSQSLFLLFALLFFVGGLLIVPKFLNIRMEKNALALQNNFTQKGFAYHYKFISNNGIFYIAENGRLGVVWRGNPKILQFIDLTTVTDIMLDTGESFGKTRSVYFQFEIDGKKQKLYTLRSSSGKLDMDDPKVVEAVRKANHLCKILATSVHIAFSRPNAYNHEMTISL